MSPHIMISISYYYTDDMDVKTKIKLKTKEVCYDNKIDFKNKNLIS